MDFNRARINSKELCLLAIFFPHILWHFLYSSQKQYSMASPLQMRWLHPDFTRGKISDMCYPFFLMPGRLLPNPSQNFPGALLALEEYERSVEMAEQCSSYLLFYYSFMTPQNSCSQKQQWQHSWILFSPWNPGGCSQTSPAPPKTCPTTAVCVHCTAEQHSACFSEEYTWTHI